MTTQKSALTWKPLENWPFAIEKAPVEALIGGLLAVYEHQEDYAKPRKEKNSETVAHRYHKAVLFSPALYLQLVVDGGSHHEEKIRAANRPVFHADMVDALLSRLPDEVPKHIPRMRQWIGERNYRITRRHLQTTYAAFWDAWNSRPDKPEVEAEIEAETSADEGGVTA